MCLANSGNLRVYKLISQISSKNEEILLYGLQNLAQLLRLDERSSDTDLGIQLVNRSIGFHPRVFLPNSGPAVETGLAPVAGSRVCLHSANPQDSDCCVRGKERDFKPIDHGITTRAA